MTTSAKKFASLVLVLSTAWSPYSSSVKVPLKLERHAVALILLTHK